MTTITKTSKSKKPISMPRLLLHLEGLALLAGSLVMYANLDFKWGIFFLLLFVPDFPLIIYAFNKRTAGIVYNLVHTSIFPVILVLVSYFGGHTLGIQLSLVWLAHIGMDHVFGYGLKYPDSMEETHFSRT